MVVHIFRALVLAVHVDLRGCSEILSEHVGHLLQGHHVADLRLADAHLHIQRLIGRLSIHVIGVALPVKQIVLQKLHVRQIPFRLPSGLVVLHHGSHMDVHPVQDLSRDLVRAERVVLLFQTDVVHDHIAGVEEIPVAHILHGKTQGRKVVAVHHQHIVLSVSVQGVDEIDDELIHLVKLVHIVFPLVILFFRLRPRHLDGRILQHLFRGVFPVSLHGNRIDKIPAGRGFQAVQNVPDQHLVLEPAVFRGIRHIHVFLGGIGLKAQIFKYVRPAVEGGLVVVDSVGGIACLPEIISRALTGGLLEDRLVGILSRPEIAQIHARNALKLCVGRAGSHGRHLEGARGILLHQPVEIRDRVFRKLQKFHRRGIEKGLQLQHDDVRFLRIVVLIRQRLLVPPHDGLNRLFRIIVRLIHARSQKAAEKAVGQAVVLIGKGNVPKISGEHPLLQTEPRRPGEKADHSGQGRQVQRIAEFSLIFRRVFPQKHQNRDAKNNPPCLQNQLHRGHIVPYDIQGVGNQVQILSRKGRHAA